MGGLRRGRHVASARPPATALTQSEDTSSSPGMSVRFLRLEDSRCAGRRTPRGLVSASPGCPARARTLPLRAPVRRRRNRVVERSECGRQGTSLPVSDRRLSARPGRPRPRGFPISATTDNGHAGPRSDNHGRDSGHWWQTAAARTRSGSVRSTPRPPRQDGTHPREGARPVAVTAMDGMGPSRATTMARS